MIKPCMATGIKHGNLHGNIYSSIRVLLVEVLKKYLSKTCHIKTYSNSIENVTPNEKQWKIDLDSEIRKKKHPVLLEETPPARAPPPTTSATPEGF